MILKTPTILLMFSGGLDSLGALYVLLTDAKYDDFHIHVHRIHLPYAGVRDELERIATERILAYFKKYSPSKLSSSESRLDLPRFNHNGLFDMDIYNMVGALICFSSPHVAYLATGRTATDTLNRYDPPYNARNFRTEKLFELYADKSRKIYPVEHLTKRDIYGMLPTELRDLAWSCRSPTHDSKPCGKCKTCLDIERCR